MTHHVIRRLEATAAAALVVLAFLVAAAGLTVVMTRGEVAAQEPESKPRSGGQGAAIPVGVKSLFFELTSGVQELYDVLFLPGVHRPTILNTEKDALISDLRLLVSQWQKQFNDSQKIVQQQQIALDSATAIIRAGTPPKKNRFIAFLESPWVSTGIKLGGLAFTVRSALKDR